MYDDKTHLNETSIALNDLVIIKILDQSKDRLQRDGIYLPETFTCNMELVKGKITSVGPEAIKRFRLKVDDVVLYDQHSAYFRPPVKAGLCVITAAENVVCIVKE